MVKDSFRRHVCSSEDELVDHLVQPFSLLSPAAVLVCSNQMGSSFVSDLGLNCHCSKATSFDDKFGQSKHLSHVRGHRLVKMAEQNVPDAR